MTRSIYRIALYAGVVGLVLAFSKVHAAWIAEPPYDFTASPRFLWAGVYAAMLSTASYAVGLPEVPTRPRQVAAASTVAVVAATGGVSALQLVLGSPLLPRFVIVSTASACFPWFAVCALMATGGRNRAMERDRVVVIGDQEDSRNLQEELQHRAERPAAVVALLNLAEASPSDVDRLPIRTSVEAHDATLVVLDREAQALQSIVDQVALLHEGGIRVRTLSLFYEQWLGKLPLGELERVSLMFDIGEIHRLRYSRVKRLIDVSAALLLLPALVAVVPVIAVGNLVANRGPLLYHQPRVGKGGRVFRIHKFRTMRPDGDEGEWTEVDDQRVTRWGRVLRSTHVDELPQLVNVLRGELSLVGPRPEQPHYVEELSAKLPYYQLRHLVQPGLTGWAQVKYGYARSDIDALEKLQFEFYYLRRQALAVDIRIIVRTLRAVVPVGGPSWR